QDIEPPSTEPYARWCERTSSQLMAILLLDLTICHLRIETTEIFIVPYLYKQYRIFPSMTHGV
ncbi:hypothetical protein RNS77_05020, partial [Staphylococcus pseudintermedius]|uniref:hypothetical protein n=1 Tax=Staphylococcus pseudintermedius TaxID=283734 RepID=UPI002885C5D9